MSVFSERLKNHIEYCKADLKNPNVKRCAKCPFEELICFHYPEMKPLFEAKRKEVGEDTDGTPCGVVDGK